MNSEKIKSRALSKQGQKNYDEIDWHRNGWDLAYPEAKAKGYKILGRNVYGVVYDQINYCRHPACKSHRSHPCEICGQQWA